MRKRYQLRVDYIYNFSMADKGWTRYITNIRVKEAYCYKPEN